MNKALDISIIIGLILTITKGADLFLLNRQKAWLQDKFETITLYIDSLKPLTWLNFFKSKKFLTFLAFVWLGLSIVTFVLFAIFSDWIYLLFKFSSSTFYAGFLILFTLFRKDSRDEYVEFFIKLYSWLLKSNIYVYVVKIILFWIVLNLISFLYSILMHKIVDSGPYGSFVTFVIGIILWVSTAYLIHSSGMYTTLFLTLLVCLPIIGADLFIRFIKAVLWRILEYNKGVYAALILIATIALGIVKIIVEIKKG